MTTTRRVLYGGNQGCQISTGLTSSGIAFTGSGLFHGLLIKCDGANDVTVNVYDNTAASGTKLLPSDTIFDGTIRLIAVSFAPGVWFDNGIYVEITCSGTTEIMALYNSDER